MDRFHAFGTSHWAALGATALLSALLILWARRRQPDPVEDKGARQVAAALIVLLVTAELAMHIMLLKYGLWDAASAVPLELCDMAFFACVVALAAPQKSTAFELAYFWGLSGTLGALITPDLEWDFPDSQYVTFFLKHGGIVVCVLYLSAGLRRTPRTGAWWRVMGWTAAYATCVGIVDWISGANFFYLREKPEGNPVLAPLGPWPYYIAGGALLALVLNFFLDLPFRPRRRRT